MSPEWDAARRLFDASLERRPSCVLRPHNLSAAVELAAALQRDGEPFTIKSGGHSAAGLSVQDDVPVVDMSALRGVEVDDGAQEVTVEGGALIADLDAATSRCSMATTAGIVSHTGLVGLACGGGLGWLMGRLGLACDNILRARVVSGGVERVIDGSSPDFAVLRGFGTSLGFVATLTLRVHPIEPLFVWSVLEISDMEGAVHAFGRAVRDLPDSVGCSLTIRAEGVDGGDGVVDVIAPQGDSHAAAWCDDLASVAQRRRDEVMPYIRVQSALDADFPFGHRSYRRSACVDNLEQLDLAGVIREYSRPWGARRSITFDVLHGAALSGENRMRSSFDRRRYTCLFITRWADASMDKEARENGRFVFSIATRHLGDHSAYGNYSSEPLDSAL